MFLVGKIQGDGLKFLDRFKSYFGSQISSQSLNEVHIYQLQPKSAAKGEFFHIFLSLILSSAFHQVTWWLGSYKQRWPAGTVLSLYHTTATAKIPSQPARKRNDQEAGSASKEEENHWPRQLWTASKVCWYIYYTCTQSYMLVICSCSSWVVNQVNRVFLLFFCKH